MESKEDKARFDAEVELAHTCPICEGTYQQLTEQGVCEGCLYWYAIWREEM